MAIIYGDDRTERERLQRILEDVKHPNGVFEVTKYINANTFEETYGVAVLSYIQREPRQVLGKDLTLEEALALIRIARIPE